jgi:hypothetical protein
VMKTAGDSPGSFALAKGTLSSWLEGRMNPQAGIVGEAKYAS